MEDTTEHTGAQTVSSSFGSGQLARALIASYATYRRMSKDPTIALGMALSIAPVLASTWSVEGEDEEQVEFIEDTFLPIRSLIVETAMRGGIMFGWQPYEKVYGLKNGRVTIVKIKPLLQDITTIQVDKSTGAFNGFKQQPFGGASMVLDVEYALLINFRVEGTNWYGRALLDNSLDVYNEWREANKTANKYDKKVAGSHFVIYFPPGESKVEGVMMGNDVVAQRLLDTLEGSGSLAVPTSIARYMEELNDSNLGWKVTILEDSGGRQPEFVDRLKYLDALKIRALEWPERAIIEGEFGTKAEAGEHGDMGMTNADLNHQRITRFINWYGVDDILAYNYGPDARGAVRIVPAPLQDAAITFLRELYKLALTNPAGFFDQSGKIDWEALKERLGVPKADNDPLAVPASGLTKEELDGVKAGQATSSKDDA